MPTPGEVNVILRGLFLVVLRKNHVEVLLPNLGFEHVNRAGQFFGEVLLKPRPLQSPYALTGVKDGYGSFQNNNVVLKGCDYDPASSPNLVYARIVLPRPKEILAFRPPKDPVEASFDPLGLYHGKKPMSVQVLRYETDDLTKVALVHHAVPSVEIHMMGGKPFCNFHVISEPDHEPLPAHGVNGFERTISLMPSLRGLILLKEQPTNRLEDETGDHKAKGFANVELNTIPELHRTLLAVGKILRDGTQLAGALVGSPPVECAPVLTDMSGG